MISFRGIFTILCLLAGVIFCLAGCQKSEPDSVRIGFVGGLTGRTANLGVAGRDGALLAVEEFNRAGGLDGRPVELIVADDMQQDERAVEALEMLLEAKVRAIVGPMTSSMAVKMAPVINRENVLMISPTTSTMLLGGQDDFFLRVYPQCVFVTKQLAEHIYHDKQLKRIAVIYDLDNRAFTESWKHCFSERFTALGGKVVSAVSFHSGGVHRFGDLVQQACSSRPDSLLILANSLDSAMLAQQVLKVGQQVPIFTSEWSMTRDLINSGGRSVEGVSLFHSFNESSTRKSYLDFKQRFEKRFKRTPSFPAIHAYDAMQILLSGFRQGGRSGAELKEILLKQGRIETLQGALRFDRFGDVRRDLFLTVVVDGHFEMIKQIPVSSQE